MWIATNESRVRVETRMISGEQYDVWNWIQPEPPPTEVDIYTSLHLVCIQCTCTSLFMVGKGGILWALMNCYLGNAHCL